MRKIGAGGNGAGSARLLIALALLAALLLLGCAQNAQPPGQPNQQRPLSDVPNRLSDLWDNWRNIWFLMVGIAVAAVAVAYMVSEVTGNEQLKAWAKNELVQVFFSVLAIMAAIGGVAVGTQVFDGLAAIDPQSQTVCRVYEEIWPCHVALGENYLDILFMSSVDNAKHLITFNSYLMPVATTSFQFGQMAGLRASRATTPFSGLTMLGENLATIFDMLVKTMMAIRFQQFLIDFSVQYLFPVSLVMGLLFRTFFFTRKLGGLLIAIALSLYFVFPTMYAINGWVLYQWAGGYDVWSGDPLFSVHFDDTGVAHPGFAGPVSNSTNASSQIQGVGSPLYINYSHSVGDRGENVSGAEEIPQQLPIINDTEYTPDPGAGEKLQHWATDKFITSSTSVLKIAWYMVNLGLGYGVGGFDFFLGMNGFVGNVAKLFLFSLVVPFIGVMTTLATIKALSPMLGGDTEIAGLTHLI